MADVFAGPTELLERTATVRVTGRVVEVTGLTVVATGLPLPVGTACTIVRQQAERSPPRWWASPASAPC